MATSRVQQITKKYVKPFSPTPGSLRSCKLSLIDQLMTRMYIPIVAFYPNSGRGRGWGNDSNNQSEYAHLQNSLSKVLTSYYPLAGRLSQNDSINCNDAGIEFLEARISTSMEDILQGVERSEHYDEGIVFPCGVPWNATYNGSLLVAQLNHYDCGGKSLSVSMSHKVGDAHSVYTFISKWAAIARQLTSSTDGDIMCWPTLPCFTGASIVPPNNSVTKAEFERQAQTEDNLLTRRFSFDDSKLSKLRSKIASKSMVQDPSKVEIITALLYKSSMLASFIKNNSSFNPSSLLQAVNTRFIGLPQITLNSAGNFVSCFDISTENESQMMDIPRMVSHLREQKLKTYEKYKRISQNSDAFVKDTFDNANKVKRLKGFKDYGYYNCSSLRGYPPSKFDFGWGKPNKVFVGPKPIENFFILTDDPDRDAVEAMVTLNKQNMSVFEGDKLLENAMED